MDDKKVKILFLAANPNDTSRLRLGEEFKKIDSELQQSRYRDQFELVQMHAVSVGDLQELLLRFQPDIVHFSGHGSEEGALIFEHKSGFSEELPTDALSDLFSIVNRDKNIRCVVLDACYSGSQAKTIGNYVDCVIGMSKAVTERAAALFSASFYRALGFGKNIKDAFDLGRNELKLQSIGEEQTPIMHHRPGVSVEKILLVNPKIHASRTNPVKHADGSIRKEILIAVIAGPLATIIAISWPAIAGYVDEMNQSGIIPIAVAEDCESFSPQNVAAEKVGQDWKIVDVGSGYEILDFKANEQNAEHGTQVIKSYGFNQICFVGRPYNPLNNPVLPMMYFVTNGTAAREIPIEQNCKQLNPQAVSAQRVGENWLVLDSNVRIYDFGAGQKSKENAERGAQVIKSYGFNKICFVERPFQPMTYFVISEDRIGSSGNTAGFIFYLAGKQIIVDGKPTPEASGGGVMELFEDPQVDCGPGNTTSTLPGNATTAEPTEFSLSIISPANNQAIVENDVPVHGSTNAAIDISVVKVWADPEDVVEATPIQTNDWSEWDANLSVSNDGVHWVIAKAFDIACNWDQESSRFVVDTHPPIVTVDSHTSEQMVNARVFTISGTATDYPFSGVQWVKVRIDNDQAIDAEGTDPWNLDLSSLTEGSHRINATAKDYAGHENYTVIQLTVDFTAPELRISEPANNTVIDTSTFVLHGSTADPISGVQKIQYKIDDSGTWIDLPESSSWTLNVSELDDGLHIISVRSEDRAGNASPVLSFFITIDTPPPITPVITSPDPNAYLSDETPLIRGTAPQGSLSIDIFDDTVLLGTAIPNGATWSFTPPAALLDGIHDIIARAKDATGTVLSSSNAITITIDTIDPTVSIDSPANNATIDGITFTVSGTASDAGSGLDKVEVFVDDSPSAVVGKSFWSSELEPLSEGKHTIIGKATDNAGNTDSTSIPVTITGNQSNIPPVADAGNDLRVQEGIMVTLDGSESRDNDGDFVLFTWTQTSGSPVNLENSQLVNPSFRVPSGIDTTEQLVFELKVTDSKGLTSSDTITITIVPSSEDSQPFSLSTTLDGTDYTVVGEDDGAALTSLTIEPDASAIRLDVLAEEESNQIEITFPNEMVSGIHTIMTDDGKTVEFEASSNDTTSTIKFNVPPDTSYVEVIATRVVPEHPYSILALVPGLLAGILFYRIKQSRSFDHNS